MKHPLYARPWINVWRETVCFVVGHRWVQSPSRHTEWWGTDDYDKRAPYVLRRRSGNILFEDVAWWSAKCTRCRFKVRPDHGDPHNVWHRELRWAMRGAVQDSRWHVERAWAERRSYPLWVSALAVPMMLVTGAAQFTLHLLRWNGGGVPPSWVSWTWDLQHWWYGLLDRKERRAPSEPVTPATDSPSQPIEEAAVVSPRPPEEKGK